MYTQKHENNKFDVYEYVIPEELRVPDDNIRHLATSIRNAFIVIDNPPADQIIVYPQSVQKDPADTKRVIASVKLVVDWCGTKSHKVTVSMQYNDKWNVLPRTIKFV